MTDSDRDQETYPGTIIQNANKTNESLKQQPNSHVINNIDWHHGTKQHQGVTHDADTVKDTSSGKSDIGCETNLKAASQAKKKVTFDADGCSGDYEAANQVIIKKATFIADACGNDDDTDQPHSWTDKNDEDRAKTVMLQLANAELDIVKQIFQDLGVVCNKTKSMPKHMEDG